MLSAVQQGPAGRPPDGGAQVGVRCQQLQQLSLEAQELLSACMRAACAARQHSHESSSERPAPAQSYAGPPALDRCTSHDRWSCLFLYLRFVLYALCLPRSAHLAPAVLCPPARLETGGGVASGNGSEWRRRCRRAPTTGKPTAPRRPPPPRPAARSRACGCHRAAAAGSATPAATWGPAGWWW